MIFEVTKQKAGKKVRKSQVCKSKKQGKRHKFYCVNSKFQAPNSKSQEIGANLNVYSTLYINVDLWRCTYSFFPFSLKAFSLTAFTTQMNVRP